MLDNKKTCELPEEDRTMLQNLARQACRMNQRLIEMHKLAEDMKAEEDMERSLRRIGKPFYPAGFSCN